MEVKLQSFNHLRCKEDALQGKSFNTINMERKWGQRSRCVVMERGVAFKNICFLSPHFFPLHYHSAGLSLLVSLSLLSDPPGPCINTFLFPHHLPPSPPLFCLSLFEQIKALSLFDKTHSVASSSWEGEKVSKRVMERGEGWYMQVQRFTAFMQPLISRAPVCSPEGHHSSQGQPCNDLPLISSIFEILKP